MKIVVGLSYKFLTEYVHVCGYSADNRFHYYILNDPFKRNLSVSCDVAEKYFEKIGNYHAISQLSYYWDLNFDIKNLWSIIQEIKGSFGFSNLSESDFLISCGIVEEGIYLLDLYIKYKNCFKEREERSYSRLRKIK